MINAEKQGLSSFLYSLGSLLFARHCLLCRHPAGSPFFSLPSPSAYTPFLCSECASSFKAITRPVCKKCGYPGCGDTTKVMSPIREKQACVLQPRGIGHHVALIRSGFHYEGMMMELIHRWKYQQRHLLFPLVKRLVETTMECWGADFHDVDMVVAVPLAAADWRARGFNQALVIASRCALYLGKPLKKRLLVKTRKTPKQAGLHRSSRMINLDGVFSLGRSADLAGKTIMLCDDVMTTGSTLAVAADTLLHSGARAVKCFTLCRVL